MAHEPGPHRLLAVNQLSSRPGVPSLRRALSGRPPVARFHLLGSVSGDGLRPVDLSGKSARHRSLFGFVAGQAVSLGIPWQGGSLDAGGCERIAGLAHLRRLRAQADCHRTPTVCPRAHGRRSGREPVCPGFDNHRSVSGVVSLGPVPRRRKAAVKLHTLLDLRGNIPTFVRVTSGAVHDVNLLDEIMPEAGAFYVMDRAYIDFQRLFVFTLSSAFFVVRTKSNLRMQRRYSHPVDKSTGVGSDQTVILSSFESASVYPDALRKVSYCDAETGKRLQFLTNNFTLPALTIAQIYKQRWQVELFFKWIKQHLRIKAFYGTCENAVKTQIWIAVSVYVLVAIVRKRLGLEASLYQILQILSLTLFEKAPILCALQSIEENANFIENANQLILFDF